MPRVTFRQTDGAESVIEAAHGTSVMRVAVENGVDGIVGECGGSLMCATCHVYVSDPVAGDLPPMSDDEDGMLDFAEAPRQKTSRLSCQLPVRDGAAGLVVVVPKGTS